MKRKINERFVDVNVFFFTLVGVGVGVGLCVSKVEMLQQQNFTIDGHCINSCKLIVDDFRTQYIGFSQTKIYSHLYSWARWILKFAAHAVSTMIEYVTLKHTRTHTLGRIHSFGTHTQHMCGVHVTCTVCMDSYYTVSGCEEASTSVFFFLSFLA